MYSYIYNYSTIWYLITRYKFWYTNSNNWSYWSHC